MTQKTAPEKLGSALLQTIDPKEIAEEQMRQTVEILLNLIEQLNLKVIELETENQKLRDENNRLKGEQGKPDIKANKKKGLKKDYSSEKERKKSKNYRKSSKKTEIKIDRSEIVEYTPEKLPEDAEFKGYQEVIVQDIVLKTDNVPHPKAEILLTPNRKNLLSFATSRIRGRIWTRNQSLSQEPLLWR